jgi:cell wall-associated NlpC family hydrolase
MVLLIAMALLAADTPAVVSVPVANMYSSATVQADVVSQAIYGSTIRLVEETPGWAKVRTPDDYTGWMPETSVRRAGRGQKLYASEGRVAQVGAMFANLYREPNVTRHQPVLTLPFEARLEVIAEPEDNQRWLEVRLVYGSTAWVQRGDVVFDPPKLSIPEMIAFSKRFIGLPYLWGGTSTFGYDCSGFAQMLCRRRGVIIPRDAQPQAHWSGVVPVRRQDLEPGDLLYFGKSEQRITHTGVYIGNGEFINATTNDQPIVQIDRLDDAPWTTLFVAARRLK